MTILATKLGGVNFFALQDVDGNAQTGGADARGIGNADGFEIGLGLLDLVPQFQVLAAAFTNHHRPLGGIGSHNGLQSADRHTILGPDAVNFAGEAGEEVGHNLLSGGFVPFAGIFGENFSWEPC